MSLSIFVTWALNFCYLGSQNLLLYSNVPSYTKRRVIIYPSFLLFLYSLLPFVHAYLDFQHKIKKKPNFEAKFPNGNKKFPNGNRANKKFPNGNNCFQMGYRNI